jgi:hypothetical protein
VSILALLVAMLIPYLTRAREIAKRVVCMSNLKSLATAGMGYASAHGGRGPGKAHQDTSDGSVCWADILNAEWYKSTVTLRGLFQWPTPKDKLICPNTTLYRNRWYIGEYMWNNDAAGGPDWGEGAKPEGPYGLAVNPGRVNYLYRPTHLDTYHLGALLEKFKRPSAAFLQDETEYGDAYFSWQWPGVPAHPIINGTSDGSVPPWAAGNGYMAFRHCLPRDVALYQTQATACFSFVDGHVEIVNPMMNLNLMEHYALDQDVAAY